MDAHDSPSGRRRAIDERAGWLKWSFESCAQWLRWRCDLSRSAAREKVRVAHALKELPETSRAFAEGSLSYSKVRALTRVATPANEESLLAFARSTTPGCTHKRFVDAHHVRHWADGGETSLENTMLLCSRHHRLVHEGGYEIRKDHEDRWYFRRADGRAIPACGYHPDDVLDEVIWDGADAAAEGASAEAPARSFAPPGSSGVRDARAAYHVVPAPP